jgi:hypothetical protein
VCNSCENTSKGQSILCFVILNVFTTCVYHLLLLLLEVSFWYTIVCFITFLPFESWFLHLWFHFSLFAKNANSPHHTFVLLPFFAKCKPTHYLILLFLFSFTQKCIFFFLHGIQLHEKSSNPTSSNCHFCMVH